MPDTKVDPGAELLKKWETATGEPEADEPAEPTQPATPEPTEVETPKPAAKHPAWLSRAAKKAGFEDADLLEMSTDDLKEALVVRGQERAAGRIADAVAINAAGKPYDPATGQLLPASAVPAAAPAQPEKPFSLKDALGVDPSVWKDDTGTEEILSSVVKPLLDRIAKLEAGLDGMSKAEQGRQVNAHFDRLDQLFAEDTDKFGAGTRHRLKDPAQVAKRRAVINRMGELHKEVSGISLEDAFERASEELFGSKAAPAAQATPAAPAKEDPTVLKFAQAATIKPANRNGVGLPKGRRAAEANVATILKERAASEGSTEHDELPE